MVMRSLRAFPLGWKLFWNRCSILPFETAIAALTIWAGFMSFFNITVTSQALANTLPDEINTIVNLIYLMAGSFTFAGIGWGYRNIETSGLTLLSSGLGIRMLVLWYQYGFQTGTTSPIIQSGVFLLACLMRIIALLKHKTYVLSNVPEIDSRHSLTISPHSEG